MQWCVNSPLHGTCELAECILHIVQARPLARANCAAARLLTSRATQLCPSPHLTTDTRMWTLMLLRWTSAWRHWGCVTPTILKNMKKNFEDPAELDGYEDLKPEDQEKINKAYEDGHVADEDVPESARKPDADEEDEEKPKKKAAPRKKKTDDDDGEEKPKKARAPRKKKTEDDDAEEKPKKKRAPPKKKAKKVCSMVRGHYS
jgi:hypothetical protein